MAAEILQTDGRNFSSPATNFAAVSINDLDVRHLIVEVDNQGGTAEQDTGFDFTAGDIIKDVWVEVLTAEATGGTKTIDVGLLSTESGGDTDGFLDGVSVAATGPVWPSLADGATTVGALMREDSYVGAGTAYVKKPHVVSSSGAKSLVYQFGSSFSELRARIHVVFYRHRSEK